MTVQEQDARDAKALRIEEELTNRAIKLAESRRKRSYDRWPWLVGCVCAVLVAAVVLALIGWGWTNTRDDDRERTEQIRLCLETGGSWLMGNTCLQPLDR